MMLDWLFGKQCVMVAFRVKKTMAIQPKTPRSLFQEVKQIVSRDLKEDWFSYQLASGSTAVRPIFTGWLAFRDHREARRAIKRIKGFTRYEFVSRGEFPLDCKDAFKWGCDDDMWSGTEPGQARR